MASTASPLALTIADLEAMPDVFVAPIELELRGERAYEVVADNGDVRAAEPVTIDLSIQSLVTR